MNPTDTKIADSLREKISTVVDAESAISNYKNFLCAVSIRQEIENPRPSSLTLATGIRPLVTEKTLKAGTVIKIQGFPVELKSDVEAESANWELIDAAKSEAERVVPDADGGL